VAALTRWGALLAAGTLAAACSTGSGAPPAGGMSGAPGTGGEASGAGGGAPAGSTGSATGGSTGTGGSGATATGGSAAASGGHTGAAGAAGGTGGLAGSGGAGTGGQSAGTGGGTGGAHEAVDAGRTDAAHTPDAGTGLPGTHNPVLPGYNADPQIALFDGTFYIYPITDGFANWASTSFSVFSSPDLVNWTDRGVALNLPKDLTWATAYAWAPSIIRAGSTYYFYFCANKQIGVATGTSPVGPFKDALGHALVTTSEYGTQSIDPYVFVDGSTTYLYFGSGTNGIRMVKLNADLISFDGTPANVSPSGASGTIEGTAVFTRNGTYYMQWSEGDTRNATYRVAYAKAAAAAGPFSRLGVILQEDTTLGVLGPGGDTVLAIPERDEYYMVYHRFKIPGGDGTHREVCIDRMTFNGDGTIVPVKPTLLGLQAAVAP